MENGDRYRWSDRNHQQQPHVRVNPWIGNTNADAWINPHQAAQLAEHLGLHHTFVDNQVLDGSGDHQPAIVPRNPAWLEEIMQELSVASTGKQIAVGSFAGWCSGYLLGRVGKAAALAVGGSLIIIQVAHYNGLIHVNWNKVQRSVESTQRKLGQRINNSNVSATINTILQFGRRHVFLAGSFGAGFLIGLTM